MTTEVQASAAPVAAPAAPVTTAAPAAPATTVSAPAAPSQVTGMFGPAFEYQPLGSPGIDMALQFFGGLGLGPENPALAATESGDFGPLKALLAGKGVPGWEQYVALAEQAHGDFAKQAQEAEAATGQMCVAAAGSLEVWQDTLAWAGAEAEPAERETINNALAGGGLMAEAMAHFLVGGFRQSAGATIQGKPAVNANAGAQTAASAGPLDPRAYGAAVAQLHGKLGSRMQGSQELAALDRRRAMYRG